MSLFQIQLCITLIHAVCFPLGVLFLTRILGPETRVDAFLGGFYINNCPKLKIVMYPKGSRLVGLQND